VVTANIHAWRDSEHDDNLERLCALMRCLQPDVLCLNEVLHPFAPPPPSDPYWEAVRSRRGRGLKLQPPSDPANTCLERLRRALGLEHCTFGAATVQGSFFGDVPFGNAILSRFPLERVAHLIMAPEEGDETLGEQERTPEDLEVPHAATLTRRARLSPLPLPSRAPVPRRCRRAVSSQPRLCYPTAGASASAAPIWTTGQSSSVTSKLRGWPRQPTLRLVGAARQTRVGQVGWTGVGWHGSRCLTFCAAI
jgi:hypothetical protein